MTITSYIMEDAREADRLAAKVDSDLWVAQYLNSLSVNSQHVLDVGCGPGVLAATAARLSPRVQFVGVDISEARIAAASKEADGIANLTLRVADALDLPFRDGTFDLVYSRFLLEYLPDKRQAISEMSRVCRPGGCVLLQDLDGQLVWHDPVDESLQKALETALSALRQSGFDPFVGRRLYGLMYNCGFRDLATEIEPYHLFGGAIDPVNRALWETKLDIALKAVERCLGSRCAAAQLKHDMLKYLDRPDTLTYSVQFTVTGRRPVQ